MGAAAAVGVPAFTTLDAASAAVTWGHPFTWQVPPSDTFRCRETDARGDCTRFHYGLDYAPGAGTPIHAVADGFVVLSNNGSGTGYGERVWVQHTDGWRSTYNHMQVGTRIGLGTTVRRGEYVGRVGNTGASYGAHLHIETHINGTPVDPYPLIHNAPPAGGAQPEEPEPQPEEPKKEDEETMFLIYANDPGASPSQRWAVVGPGFWFVVARQDAANGLSLRAGAQITVTWEEWDRAFAAAVSSGFVPAAGQTSRTV